MFVLFGGEWGNNIPFTITGPTRVNSHQTHPIVTCYKLRNMWVISPRSGVVNYAIPPNPSTSGDYVTSRINGIKPHLATNETDHTRT